MNRFVYILIAIAVLSGCAEKPDRKELVTVSGRIPVSEMGLTLIHEHIMVDFIGADSTGAHRWNRAEVIARAMPFLMEAKQRGVRTFLDCTPAYLGRDPQLLKELSGKTGLNILTNTGYYGAGKNKFIPKQILDKRAEEIAEIWVREFENGIDGHAVYPGFIKISVDDSDQLSPMHEKLVRAAAITHRVTGMTIVSHTGKDGPAFAQLKVLRDEGVGADAFVWTHAQAGTVEGYIRAAKEGAWISIDNLSKGNGNDPGGIEWLMPIIKRLKEEGLLHKLLISHDAGWYHVGEVNGGDFRGYTDIFDHFVPAMLKNGFTPQDVDMILVNNPRSAYAIQVRGGH